jgi:phage shock protein A
MSQRNGYTKQQVVNIIKEQFPKIPLTPEIEIQAEKYAAGATAYSRNASAPYRALRDKEKNKLDFLLHKEDQILKFGLQFRNLFEYPAIKLSFEILFATPEKNYDKIYVHFKALVEKHLALIKELNIPPQLLADQNKFAPLFEKIFKIQGEAEIKRTEIEQSLALQAKLEAELKKVEGRIAEYHAYQKQREAKLAAEFKSRSKFLQIHYLEKKLKETNHNATGIKIQSDFPQMENDEENFRSRLDDVADDVTKLRQELDLLESSLTKAKEQLRQITATLASPGASASALFSSSNTTTTTENKRVDKKTDKKEGDHQGISLDQIDFKIDQNRGS